MIHVRLLEDIECPNERDGPKCWGKEKEKVIARVAIRLCKQTGKDV